MLLYYFTLSKFMLHWNKLKIKTTFAVLEFVFNIDDILVDVMTFER